MALEEYQRKRRFEETPEPPAKIEKKAGHRFVVQKHRATRLHYDQFGAEASGGVPAETSSDADLSPLTNLRELALLHRLGEYSEILENAANELAPHQIVFFLRELAGEFHSYYNAERILVPEKPLRLARLALCVAVRQVLRNGLSLLGVSQPEKM